VERQRVPVTLTAEGEALLKTATQVVEQMGLVRHRIRSSGAGGEAVLRIATGRSLSRTVVGDWIARLRHRAPKVLVEGTQLEISTGKMEDMAMRLEQGKVDLLCCYEHPALSMQLNPVRYRYMTLGTDKLVPVSQADGRGRARYALSEGGQAAPLITYAGGLSMERILGDRLEATPYALTPFVRIDSLDAAHGAALKGLGVAWLPWSMVAADCRRGTLVSLGGRSDEIAFEVRLYRSRARLADLAEAAWEATANRKA
jgi:DNA-binding transcriptional LysR family regulator